MLSAICFNLDPSRILSSHNVLNEVFAVIHVFNACQVVFLAIYQGSQCTYQYLTFFNFYHHKILQSPWLLSHMYNHPLVEVFM